MNSTYIEERLARLQKAGTPQSVQAYALQERPALEQAHQVYSRSHATTLSEFYKYPNIRRAHQKKATSTYFPTLLQERQG